MTDSSHLRRTQDDDSPVRPQPEAEPDLQAQATAPGDAQARTSTPAPRFRYRAAGVAAESRTQLPDDRAAALTRQALEALGGQEERSLHLQPEAEVRTRLVGDETLEFGPRTDATALVPEEQSRQLGATGREEGVVSEEEFRREAELRPDDLDEIARERQDMVRAFHAEQGAQLLDAGELARVLGPVPVPEHASDQQGTPEQPGETGRDPRPSAVPAQPLAAGPVRSDAGGRGRQLLAGESGERALQLITQGISARFQAWLRKDGQWHKRSEWFKKHLARVWEYAPDALNPGTLLFAPKGRPRLAAYVQTEPGQQRAAPTELNPSKASKERETAEQEAARGRTRKAAATGQHERQIKEARVRAVTAVTQSIAKNWAEARDLAWPLNATNDDLSAFVKTPQDGALNAWAATAPEQQR